MNYIEAISKYRLRISQREGKCKFDYKPDQVIDLGDMVKKGICPYFYNNLAIYISVLDKGGHFKWRKVKNTVEVLCPNPSGLVNALLTKNDSDLLTEIVSVEKECPFGYKKGDRLPQVHETEICPYAFIAVFPKLVQCALSDADAGEAGVRCPSSLGEVIFQIEKKEEFRNAGK